MYILPFFFDAGFPKGNLVTTYAIAQMMFESDWMTSNVANTDNNYSGITYLNKPYQNATKGLPMPASESKTGHYAHFSSIKEWVKDFYRILNLNTGGQGKPIDAKTANEYVSRLKANHYFTSPNYSTGFNAALRKVSEALTWGQSQEKEFLKQRASGQDTFTDTAGKGLTSNEEFSADRLLNKLKLYATDHPFITAGAAVVSLLTLKKILE
jgi:hypothetical protein